MDTFPSHSIIPPHDVTDTAKRDELVRRMRSEGWVGSPLLTMYDPATDTLYAMMGAHRLNAAYQVKLSVPVHQGDYDTERVAFHGDEVWVDGQRLSDFSDRVLLSLFARDAVAVRLLEEESEHQGT